MHGYSPLLGMQPRQRKTADPRVEWQLNWHPKKLFFECGNRKPPTVVQGPDRNLWQTLKVFLEIHSCAGFDSCAGSLS